MEESSIITLIGAIGYSQEVCFMTAVFGWAYCMRTLRMRTPLIVCYGFASSPNKRSCVELNARNFLTAF
jgi:hypothetical protein